LITEVYISCKYENVNNYKDGSSCNGVNIIFRKLSGSEKIIISIRNDNDKSLIPNLEIDTEELKIAIEKLEY
jgi:hypothetical protein